VYTEGKYMLTWTWN